jgi:hypothetical protein
VGITDTVQTDYNGVVRSGKKYGVKAEYEVVGFKSEGKIEILLHTC